MKDFSTYEKEFSKRAENAGFSSDEVVKCLRYSETLFKSNLPVIYNSAHLAALVGYNLNYLRRAVKGNNTKYFYRKYSIPKKNGKQRVIQEPLPSLKEIQRWLLDNIFYKIPISQYAKAYTPKRGIRDHVKYHTNEDVVITLDIENFFNELNSYMLEECLLSKGYSSQVSNLITKICTLEECLPQGAPTSPRISNILLLDFDNAIAKYTKEKKIKYTRYADDIAISGTIENPQEIILVVENELKKLSLNLNASKTNIMHRGNRQIISGIVVNQKAQIPREIRYELKQAMNFIDKYGLESHLAKINCKKSSYLEHLLGLANYILTINPKDEKTKNIYLKLKKLVTS